MTDLELDAPAAVEARTHMVGRLRALVEAGTTELADRVLRVPLEYYRDPELFGRERAELMTTPLAFVPTARVREVGDYVVREVSGTSVVVARGDDGVARAFLNYCRHRGARPAEGCGSTRRFTCPYHAWSYDTSGQLVGMPGQEGFCELDRTSHGLVELPSEERHGFVWVVLTADAPIDVAAHLGPLDAELASWGFAEYQHVVERRLESAVNWKAALEAFAETYHFPYVHGSSLVGQNTVGNTSAYDAFGLHHRLGFACPWIVDAPEADVHPTPLDYVVFVYWVYPNLVLAVSPVGVELIDLLPGAEPVSCVLTHGWMAAVPAPDDETRAGYLALFEAVHAAIRDEDFAVLPSCGDAMAHGQHEHMVVGRNEIGVQHVVRTFAERFGVPLG